MGDTCAPRSIIKGGNLIFGLTILLATAGGIPMNSANYFFATGGLGLYWIARVNYF